MSTTIERPDTIPMLDDEELERLRRVKEEHEAAKAPVTDQSILDALTEERFLAWLDAQEDTAIVGYPGNGFKCPLYTYLNETFDGRATILSVGGTVNWHGGSLMQQTALPRWANRFIGYVDQRRNRVPAKSAKKIVRAIRKEMSP